VIFLILEIDIVIFLILEIENQRALTKIFLEKLRPHLDKKT